MLTKILIKQKCFALVLIILVEFLSGCQKDNRSLDSFYRDSEKYDWLLSTTNSDKYDIISSLDTTSMVISEEDNKFKKCRTRCVVIESTQLREVNLMHFTKKDTVVRYKDKIALIIFDVEENNYHDTIVVDIKYMTKSFNFYSSHKKQVEKDSVFFNSYAMLESPVYLSNEHYASLDFMFGIPFTKKIYGSTLLFYSAGYYSICNNMINTLYGE